MTLLASSNDSSIHSLTNAETKGRGENKATEVADLNDTRNDDQQVIVVKQEVNQRSSADTKNKVIAPSLENDSGHKDTKEAQYGNNMVVILKSEALSHKDDIKRMVENEDFLITQQREVQLTINQASDLFKEEANEMMESMTRGPIFAMVLQKNSADVIQDWQRLIGHHSDETNVLYHNVVHNSQSFEQAKKDVELLFHDSCVTQHENNAIDGIDQQQQHKETTQSQSLSADVDKSIEVTGVDTVSPSTEHITERNAADPKVLNEEEEKKKDIVVNVSPCSSTNKLQEAQMDAAQSTTDDVVNQYSPIRENTVTCDEKKDDPKIMVDSLDESKVAPPQEADPQKAATHPPPITEHKQQSKTQSKSKQQPLSNDEPNINIPNVAHKRAKMPRVALHNPKQISQPDKVPLPIAKKKTSPTKSRLARLTAPTISSSRKSVTAYEMESIDTKPGSQTATIAIKAARSRILSPRK